MKDFVLALNWFFGSVSMIIGISLITSISLLGGVGFIVISSMMLPPVRTFVYSKTKKKLSAQSRFISICILFACSFGLTIADQYKKLDRENSEQIAKAKQERIDSFNTNKEQIISEMQSAFDSTNYSLVVREYNQYAASGDEELKKIYDRAKVELKKISDRAQIELAAKKTNSLLDRLKTIPTKEYAKNKELYQQLVNLHPNNKGYAKKLKFYKEKIKIQANKIKAAAERDEKIQAQFHPWDGSHINLERYIEDNMNDPDSYDHVETVYWDRGDYLTVQTTFRGKNAFGGVVINSIKANVSLDGQLLRILE